MHCVGQSDSLHCTFLVDYSVILWLYFYCCPAIIAIKDTKTIGILVHNLCAEIWCLTSLQTPGSITQILPHILNHIYGNLLICTCSNMPVTAWCQCYFQPDCTPATLHYISTFVWEQSFSVTTRFCSSEICKQRLFSAFEQSCARESSNKYSVNIHHNIRYVKHNQAVLCTRSSKWQFNSDV